MSWVSEIGMTDLTFTATETVADLVSTSLDVVVGFMSMTPEAVVDLAIKTMARCGGDDIRAFKMLHL